MALDHIRPTAREVFRGLIEVIHSEPHPSLPLIYTVPTPETLQSDDIPRPPNCFILFKAWISRGFGSEEAVIADELWQELKLAQSNTVAHFRRLAREAKAEHILRFPRYQYRPQPRRTPHEVIETPASFHHSHPTTEAGPSTSTEVASNLSYPVSVGPNFVGHITFLHQTLAPVSRGSPSTGLYPNMVSPYLSPSRSVQSPGTELSTLSTQESTPSDFDHTSPSFIDESQTPPLQAEPSPQEIAQMIFDVIHGL